MTTHTVKLADISPSNGNERKIKPADVKSLAESMQKVGLLYGLIVRKAGKQYEIVAGHRRFEAAKLLKWTEIEAQVVEADDQEAQTYRVIENFQRENLTPLQEAAAIERLTALGRSPDEIAADLGTSPQMVARRARLTKFSKAWLKVLKDPETAFARLQVASLEKIAARSHDQQDGILSELQDNYNDDFRPEDVNQIISDLQRLLSSAPWSLKDADLVPAAGSCEGCPKRSGNQPLLFHDDPKVIQKEETCLDTVCWKSKGEALFIRKEVELKEGGKFVYLSTNYSERKGCSPLYNRYQVTELKKPQKGSVKALVIDGPEFGHVKDVKLHRQQETATKTASEGKSEPATMAEKKKRLEGRRYKVVAGDLKKLVSVGSRARLSGVLIQKSPEATLIHLLALVMAFGCGGDGYQLGSYHKTFKSLVKMSPDALVEHFWKHKRSRLETAINTVQKGSIAYDARDMMKTLFGLLGEDFTAHKKAADVTCPVPKSWGKGK